MVTISDNNNNNCSSSSTISLRRGPSNIHSSNQCQRKKWIRLLLLTIVSGTIVMTSLFSSPNRSTSMSNLLINSDKNICDEVTSVEKSTNDDSTAASTISSALAMKFNVHARILTEVMKQQRGYKPKSERRDNALNDAVGSYWWLDEKVEESFSFAQLDQTYDTKYFKFGGHPGGNSPYTKYIQRFGSLFMPNNNKVGSLVEFGNGGGGYSTVFLQEYGEENFITVEGTGAGIAETLHRGIPQNVIVQHDLRLPLYLGRRFDIAVCTEVVEHVEPPFASQIILTLILHADVIWFSYKPLGLVNKAWINHPNERPLKMWKNLFDFYGYDIVLIPPSIHKYIAWRGDFLAYRKDNTTLNTVTEQMLLEHTDPEHK